MWQRPVNTSNTNAHGVEVRSVHFRTQVVQVPKVCESCPLFEDTEFDYDGNFWAFPFCRRGLKLPTKKGTCKTKPITSE